jgi:nucleotide-binding universal stress UspA family protein
MFQRLLICTDFFDGLQRLTGFTSSLAASGIKHLTFLHCVPLDERGRIPKVDTVHLEQARKRLASAIESVPAGLEVQIVVESGRPNDLILKLARDRHCDLIVLGVSLRTALSETLFGSTTRAIHEQSTVPILTLRPQLITTYSADELALRCQNLFKTLMIPYDGTAAARHVVAQVKQRVQANSPTLLQGCTLCWVLGMDRRDVPQQPFIEAAQTALLAVKTELDSLGLQVRTEVRQGEAVIEVLEACSEPDISAIALSTNTRNRLASLYPPSFAQEMLQKSWHPILFFPQSR